MSTTTTSVAVKKTYFKYGNVRYFRTMSEAIELGTFGQKKTPLTRANYVSPFGTIARKHLVGRVRYQGRVRVDWDEVSSSDYQSSGEVRYYTVKGKSSVGISLASARKAHLELVKFSILEGDLIKLLNRDANAARRYLADEGNDARVVSDVFVVVEAELAESFERAGTHTGSISALTPALGLELTGKHAGSGSGSATVVLEKGTTFAYGLHKVKDWSKGKAQILDLEDDHQGLG